MHVVRVSCALNVFDKEFCLYLASCYRNWSGVFTKKIETFINYCIERGQTSR